MVDINIKSGQGISHALADYAKQLNGGKALKINAKQWQSIMTTVNAINSKRSASKIFSGSDNIFGKGNSNFIVHEGKISFSDEEMSAILKQMGLNQDIIDREFSSNMNIKGLFIEKTAPQATPQTGEETNLPESKPLLASEPENKTLSDSNTPKLFIPSPEPFKIRSQFTNTSFVTHTEQPTTNLPAQTSQQNVQVLTEQVKNEPEPSSNDKYMEKTPVQNENRNTLLEVADDIKFYSDGTIKSVDLNIKDLNWKSKSARNEWNENNQLVSNELDDMIVKNSSGKTIATYHEGKFFIDSKEVNFDKFQKFTAKNGHSMTLKYKPDLKPIQNIAGHLPAITKTQTSKPYFNTQIELEKLKELSEKTNSIQKQYTNKTLTPEFYKRVEEIAKKINCTPADLLAVMNSESGLNANAKNKYTGATGLIQFMPKTARALGTSVEELSNMSELQQLDFVEKYLVNAKKSYIKSDRTLGAGDLYGLIFMPAKTNHGVFAQQGTKAYRQNRGLDYDGDGIITKKDLEAHVNTKQVGVNFRNA